MTISHSETITKLMGALLTVQGQVEGVAKDSTNPHFRAKYASLEAVHEALRGPLQEAGLVVMQAPGEFMDGTLALTTFIAHAESGEWIKSTLQIPVGKQDPQGAGSALSYAERYSLMALFCLPAVDDDGEAAQRPAQRQESRPASSPAPRPEARPAKADESPDGIRARMLAAISNATSVSTLEGLTSLAAWKGKLDSLPEPHKVTIRAAITRRLDDLARVPA